MTRRPLYALTIAAALTLSLGACAATQTVADTPPTGEDEASATSGETTKKCENQAPSNLSSFEVIDLNGEMFDLSEHLGCEVVLLSFWATFCEPCKTEMPTIQKLHNSYADKGLKVLSVALDGPDTVSGVDPYYRSNGYTFQCAVDQDSSIVGAFNPKSSMPFTVLIGRDGKIAKKIEGFQLSEAAMLEAEVRELLGLHAGE